ncbi:MAG TPA: signal peptidase II [Bacteroidales bacterium]|nr:signal peptidase II [Bacteroidales bacterium]HPT22276.1 signal peptidase II [Bacteroidales bacterium]
MNINKTLRNLLIVIFLVADVGCDQISKGIVRQRVDYHEQITVIDNFITLTRVDNTGAFLSLGNSLPRTLYKVLMIILPLIVLIFILRYLFKHTEFPLLSVFGISLIVGGGIGNIIDRVIFGSVTDFLYFDFALFHTGIVNWADISVTAGFFILVYEMIVNRKKNEEKVTK